MKTVFVVGAGASCEFGFPDGNRLKEEIGNKLGYGSSWGGDRVLMDLAQGFAQESGGEYENELHKVELVGHEIKKSLYLNKSIDHLIHRHRDNPLVEYIAKASIVSAICNYEAKSPLVSNKQKGSSPGGYLEAVKGSWLAYAYQNIVHTCSLNELPDRFQQVTFVVFNYDRCVEKFFFESLKMDYGIANDTACEMLSYLTIIHPYGKVGDLPGMIVGNQGREFGSDVHSYAEAKQLVAEIKTFTEGADQKSDTPKRMHLAIEESERMVFLGFSFLDLNMQLLGEPMTRNREIFATTYGVSKYNESKILSQLATFSDVLNVQPQRCVHLKNLKCADFFREFEKGLGFPYTELCR